MDVAALILAVAAVVIFVSRNVPLNYGLAVLTAAWIAQLVHLTGHVLHVN